MDDSRTLNEQGSVHPEPIDPQAVYLAWTDDGVSVERNPGVTIIWRDYTVGDWMTEDDIRRLPVDEDGYPYEERVLSRG